MAETIQPLADYAAFVFDFDGVLADSVEIKATAFGELYAPHGEDIAAQVMDHHRNHGGMTRREKFLRWHKTFLDRDLNPQELEELSDRFSALVVDKVVTANEIPGAREFLSTWHGRLPLFVDSATPDNEIVEIISRRGLEQYFISVHGSDHSKVDNLRSILAENHLEPELVLFFGDAGSDLAAARACGTDFMGIVPGPDAPLIRDNPDIFWRTDFTHLLNTEHSK